MSRFGCKTLLSWRVLPSYSRLLSKCFTYKPRKFGTMIITPVIKMYMHGKIYKIEIKYGCHTFIYEVDKNICSVIVWYKLRKTVIASRESYFEYGKNGSRFLFYDNTLFQAVRNWRYNPELNISNLLARLTQLG